MRKALWYRIVGSIFVLACLATVPQGLFVLLAAIPVMWIIQRERGNR